MYTDVHCHLNFKDYGGLDELIENCLSSGVDLIITAGFDIPSSEEGMRIAEKYKNVFFTAGLHPTELKGYELCDLKRVEELCAHPKCVALGEIGLDYHYPDTDKEKQMLFFEEQIALAAQLGMPVQIHSRDCAADMLTFLTSRIQLLKSGALLHCYSHSPEMAEEFEKLGLYFSFGGTSTYKRSKKPRRAVQALPAERLLTETDSPYLPPSSMYGQFPNTPASIPEITASMAQIKGLEIAQMCKIIRSNALKLFPKLNNM